MLWLCAGLVACGGSGEQAAPEPRDGHIWKSQTDMVDRAHDVEGLLEDASDRQRGQIEEQAQ